MGMTADELEGLLIRSYRKAQDILSAREENANRRIIHGSVSCVDLDGKALVDPMGIQGTEISLVVSFSLTSTEWIRALEIISEHLKLQLTALVPHYVPYATPLPDTSALLILLDQDYSLISAVRRGKVSWVTRADMGEREIVRFIGGKLNLTEHQTDALMRRYRAGKLHDKAELRLAGVFWQALRRWMGTLAEQVEEEQKNGSVPCQLYFLDMSRHMPEARSCLETPFWEQSLPFTRCPNVTELKVNMIRDVLDCTAKASGSPYLLLRGLAQYVAGIYVNEHSFDRALLQSIDWRHRSL